MSAFAIEVAEAEKLARELFNKRLQDSGTVGKFTWESLPEWTRRSWYQSALTLLHERMKRSLRAQRRALRKASAHRR